MRDLSGTDRAEMNILLRGDESWVPSELAVFERTYMSDEDNMPRTLREHQELYDAIRDQDADAAEQAALAMIASSTKRLKDIT